MISICFELKNNNYAIYGGGFYGLHFCDLAMNSGYTPKFIIDKDKNKHGLMWNDLVPIVPLEDVDDKSIAVIVCMMDVGAVYGSVCAELEKNGFRNYIHLFEFARQCNSIQWDKQRSIIRVLEELIAEYSYEIEKSASIFKDDISIITYKSIIEALKKNNRCGVKGLPISSQYFADDIFEYNNNDIIVDIGGGPNGEYLAELINRNIEFLKYYSFDPCMNKDKEEVLKLHGNNIEFIQLGISDACEFKQIKNYLGTNAIVGINSGEYTKLVPLDGFEFIKGISILKIDTEGYEMKVIRGGLTTIMSQRPVILCAIYHNVSDFWEIPLFLSTTLFDYKFFLRSYCNVAETILYAVPTERCINKL